MHGAELLLVLLSLALLGLVCTARAAGAEVVNYDEGKVPAYTLPDPLVLASGGKVADAEAWRSGGPRSSPCLSARCTASRQADRRA